MPSSSCLLDWTPELESRVIVSCACTSSVSWSQNWFATCIALEDDTRGSPHRPAYAADLFFDVGGPDVAYADGMVAEEPPIESGSSAAVAQDGAASRVAGGRRSP